MLKSLEKWGARNPVKLAFVSGIAGFLLGAVPVGTAGYNLGMYIGGRTADEIWNAQFQSRVESLVKDRLVERCTEAVSSVHITCQNSIKDLQSQLRSREETLSSREATIEHLKMRSEVIDLHDNFVRYAEDILKAFQAARESNSSPGEGQARDRAVSMLQSMARINQIYVEWSGLFNGAVWEVMARLARGDQISTNEIMTILRAYVADADRKRKIIQSEVDFVNKTKGNKF
jgi:hypothetical protein